MNYDGELLPVRTEGSDITSTIEALLEARKKTYWSKTRPNMDALTTYIRTHFSPELLRGLSGNGWRGEHRSGWEGKGEWRIDHRLIRFRLSADVKWSGKNPVVSCYLQLTKAHEVNAEPKNFVEDTDAVLAQIVRFITSNE